MTGIQPTAIYQRVAARYRLDVILSDEIKEFAISCLEGGHWSSAIDDIVMSAEPIMSDVGPALEQVLFELGVAIPDRESAIWALLRFYLGDIASGAVAPRQGMHRVIEDVYYPADLYERTDEFIGDSHGLSELIGSFYSYDDLEERPDEVSFGGLFGEAAKEALGARIVELAGMWVREHGND